MGRKKDRRRRKRAEKRERKAIMRLQEQGIIELPEEKEDREPPEPPRKKLRWSHEFRDAIDMLRKSHPEIRQPYLGRVGSWLAMWLAPFVREGIEPTDDQILSEIERLIPQANGYYAEED